MALLVLLTEGQARRAGSAFGPTREATDAIRQQDTDGDNSRPFESPRASLFALQLMLADLRVDVEAAFAITLLLVLDIAAAGKAWVVGTHDDVITHAAAHTVKPHDGPTYNPGQFRR